VVGVAPLDEVVTQAVSSTKKITKDTKIPNSNNFLKFTFSPLLIILIK
jgi:hypothetical protein